MSSHRLALRLYQPFSELRPEEIDLLSSRSVRRRYARGEQLWREGDAAVALTIIARGRVKVIKHAPGGRDVLIEICGPGDSPGDAAVYDGGQHASSAVALEDVDAVQIQLSDLSSALHGNSEAALTVLRGMARRVKTLTGRVADLGEGGIERRLALAMCRLCEHVDAPNGSPVDIRVPLSRQDLADMVGTSLETAIRVMSRWARRGIVTTRKDGFVVLDCTALQALVGSSPRGGERAGSGAPVCVRRLPA